MKTHLIGICGTAMGAFAAMLKDRGHTVTGSDSGVYPPISDFLAERGIEIMDGYAAGNIDAAEPDLVVVGNVVSRDHPEALRTMELGLEYTSLPKALGRFVLPGTETVMASGTHGKTTTSALLAHLLNQAGADPSFMVGGMLRNFGSNYRLGGGRFFVLEGDEYDTAYFDKVPKFIHYRPKWTILTGIEFDHADIYPDIEAVEAAFSRLMELQPRDGLLLVNEESERAVRLAEKAESRVMTYGFSEKAGLRAVEPSLGPGRVEFGLIRSGTELGRFRSPLPGRHNLSNTIAALGLMLELGLDSEPLKKGLAGFEGVKRRQEVIAEIGGVTVMDDFAHHPTAVKETLAALREFYPEKRLVAVFEPRSNTSRRNFFQAEYAAAFGPADVALIRESTRETGLTVDQKLDCARLVAELTESGLKAEHFTSTPDLLARLLKIARPGDLIAILSNGGFDGLHRKLVKGLVE